MDCSVVITTYNRPDLARECVRRLKRALPESVEVIVSDDGSDPEHLADLERIDGIRLLRSTSNTGLGANINRALASVGTRYALWVQDDMWLREDANSDFVRRGVEALDQCPDVDIVRFLVPYRLAVQERRSVGAGQIDVYSHSLFGNWASFARVYSDNPHLRRINLTERVGEYREMRGHGNTETDYAFRLKRRSIGIASVVGYTNHFEHAGDGRSTQAAAAPTRSRGAWRRQGSAVKLLFAYMLYRVTGSFPDGMYANRVEPQ